MFKLKLGMHLYIKRVALNFLILVNLLVIVFGVNSLILFHNANVKIDVITKQLEKEKIINTTHVELSLDEANELSGFKKIYNSNTDTVIDVNDEKSEKYNARFYNAEFLAKLDYNPRQGRWFKEDDANTSNVVLSYTKKYKVGDKIKVLFSNSKTATINVIGILQPHEFQFSQNGFYGGTWEGNFKERNVEESIIVYGDYDYVKNSEVIIDYGYSMSASIFVQFDNSMPQDKFEEVIKSMNAKFNDGNHFSTAQMKVLTQNYKKRTNTLFVPIAVILLLLGLASFVVMSYINIKGCKTEYVVLQSLGAKRKDLLAVLGVTLIIPFVLVTILISTFSSFALLPISYYPNVTTPLNFVVAFSIMAIYLGVNVLFMSLMVLKNKGFKEVINDVE